MFAVLAFVAFMVALLGLSHIGPVDTVILGFVFVAAHLAFDWAVPWGRRQT